MKKQVTFIDNDLELVQKIIDYQKENNIKSFTETVRQLCRKGLSQSVNVKIDLNNQ